MKVYVPGVEINGRLASLRYRVKIPLNHLGWEVVGFPEGPAGCDAILVLKHFATLPMFDRLKATGLPIIWDVSDDRFNHPDVGPLYRTFARLADCITCTTPILAHRINEQTGKNAVVIMDPVGYGFRPPKLEAVNKILWYGYKSNYFALERILPDLRGYDLRIIGDETMPNGIDFSESVMKAGLEWCDVVIIPVGRDDDGGMLKRDCKSANRMTDAIAFGRYVVANDLESYRPYGMYLGDIIEGLAWTKDNLEAAGENLYQAQALVKKWHHPSEIAWQWQAVYDSILAVAKGSGRGSSTSTSREIGQKSSQMSSVT